MEPDLIQQALLQFHKETGLKAHWKAFRGTDKKLDGMLTVTFGNGKEVFAVECKREIQPVHLQHLYELQKTNKHFAVIAENVLPRAKEELRKKQIAYFDLAGNAFIQTGKHFILIDGKRPQLQKNGKQQNRAFTKAGLRVVFNLLIDPNLVNENYRKIAADADVALDTVNKTFQALKNLGHLVNADTNTFKLMQLRRLVERWIEAYPARLRPAIHIGNFRFLNEGELRKWKTIRLNKIKTQWGGEPAADLLTNYLRPEIFTLYTNETRNELMKAYRFIPDDNGPIHIYQKFWKYDEKKFKTVPPMLIYADLMHSEDPRTLETAQQIYHDYLKDRLD
jgi:hypothetical protein